MNYHKCLVILILSYIGHIQCANILAIFPMIQKSHYVMYEKLVKELVARGHNVDILGGIPSQTTRNLTG